MLPIRLGTPLRRLGGKPLHDVYDVRPSLQLALARPTSPSRFTNNSLARPRSAFSTHPQSFQDRKTSNHERKPHENPSMPQISFKDLGMSRNVKIFVYLVIGVLGTMETVFWTKAIWRWFKGGQEEEKS